MRLPRSIRTRDITDAEAERKLTMLPEKIYSAPTAEDFAFEGEELDFLPAVDLEGIAETLILQYPELAHLDKANIAYLWKRKAGKSGGKAIYGKCQKASGLVAFYSEAEFVIHLAADVVNDYPFTRQQVEALLYHELSHIVEQEDKDGNVTLVLQDHDFAGFREEVKRYGAWDASLEACKKAWGQQALFTLEQDTKKAVKAIDDLQKSAKLEVVDEEIGEVVTVRAGK